MQRLELYSIVVSGAGGEVSRWVQQMGARCGPLEEGIGKKGIDILRVCRQQLWNSLDKGIEVTNLRKIRLHEK